MNRPVAVIDCGTNSTRLLITDGAGLAVREQRITGLGRGMGAGRVLQPEAIDRVLAALSGYRQSLTDHGVTDCRAIATSAARDATNRDDFFAPAEEVLGHPLELLAGEDEARYGFRGATAGLDKASAPWLVVDIGGGSTEFSFGSVEPHVHVSVPMGSVRFTEDYIPSDPPLPEELSAAISVVHLYLDDIVREHPQVAEASTMIAVAGTATTIAAVEIGLDPYDPEVIDSFTLTRAAAEDVFRTLATESIEDRKWNPGLQPERADVIVGGCCVLVAIMRHLDMDACLIRESDLLDGMAAQLLNG